MPSPNTLRIDVDEMCYHVYSRGVEKRVVFIDDTDFEQFLFYLDRYLSPPEETGVRPNFHDDLELMSFALMSNHYHLQVYQNKAGSLAKFMKCLLNSYVRYFNDRHERVGPLFQSRYKSSEILSEPYWVYISKYIHKNPIDYTIYPHSSAHHYLRGSSPTWLDKSRVLSYFQSSDDYKKYLAQ